MATNVLLINGITLPYQLLDTGVECSKQENSLIRVVFIYRNNKKDHQASIDSVLTIPAFTERKAEQNLETLIRTNVAYTKAFFKRKQIDIETVIMANPSVSDVAESLTNTSKVFLHRDSFNHPKDFAFVDFLYEHLEEKLNTRLHNVSSARV